MYKCIALHFTLPQTIKRAYSSLLPTKRRKEQINLFECFEDRVDGLGTLHGICHNGLGQGLGGARFADHKQRDAELHTHHHHEHVLLQGLVTGNLLSHFHILQ